MKFMGKYTTLDPAGVMEHIDKSFKAHRDPHPQTLTKGLKQMNRGRG